MVESGIRWTFFVSELWSPTMNEVRTISGLLRKYDQGIEVGNSHWAGHLGRIVEAELYSV